MKSSLAQIPKSTFSLFIFLLIFLISLQTYAEDNQNFTSQEIVEKSMNVYAGDDTTSTLTFQFREKGKAERKIVYSLIWKSYEGHKDLNQKMIFIKEFPAQEKGISFMLWTYQASSGKNEEQWFYMPELRTVRKLGQQIQSDNGGNDNKNDFAPSVLQRVHLENRAVDNDNIRLVNNEKIKGKSYYVIERKPKKPDANYPYNKTLNWINKDNFVLSKIEYYDAKNQLVMKQQFKWQKIKNAWLWDKVLAKDYKTGAITLLKVSNLKVNTGLKDRVFTKRTMKLGTSAIK